MIGPADSRDEYSHRFNRTTSGRLTSDPSKRLSITGYWDAFHCLETMRSKSDYWVVQWTAILDRNGTFIDGRSPERARIWNEWDTEARMKWVEELGVRDGLGRRQAREVARIAAAAQGNLETYVLDALWKLRP
jgi:hypothetical protein